MNKKDELFFHKSVLIEEVLFYLNIKKNGIYVDATFGSGGHTRAILEKEPTACVIGIDWDRESLDKYGSLIHDDFGDRFIPMFGNFAHLYKLLKRINIPRVDGILADFGTSQMQIKERPGFSLYHDLPLDMRMSVSHQKITAAQVLNEAPAALLEEIFYVYGEERFSRKITRAIIHDRKTKPFRTTKQLADLIRRVVPASRSVKIHPATRVFQALRIYINKELDNIKAFLKGAVEVLEPEGRLVCISFHSLEDRLVKQFFKKKKEEGGWEILTKKTVTPERDEIAINPASRSAKLRAIARITI